LRQQLIAKRGGLFRAERDFGKFTVADLLGAYGAEFLGSLGARLSRFHSCVQRSSRRILSRNACWLELGRIGR
jgi:hypothetical protein